MKKILQRGMAIALSLALSLAGVSAQAAVLGEQLRNKRIVIAEGTSLANGVFWSSSLSDKQTENYIEYTPNTSVVPIVAYGSQLYGRSTLNYITNYLESNGMTVIAGVNADFFEFSTGVSLGPLITGGILRSEGGDKPSVGFYSDGTAIIGNPGINIKITGNNLELPANLNKEMAANTGVCVYTRDYAANNKATIPTYNIVLNVDSAALVIGDSISAVVESIQESESAFDIPDGKIVLSIAQNTEYSWTYENLVKPISVGDRLTISVTANPGWEDVVYAVGGGDKLVTGGVAATNLTGGVKGEAASRTVIGIKADGTVVLYTVDGRQSGYSAGATLDQTAQRMVELGCVEALNLDGGGSTVLGSQYPGYSSVSTVNSPSDGSQRSCANYIFLVNKTSPTSEVDKLYLYPYDVMMVQGATQTFTAKAADSSYFETSVPAGIQYYTDEGMGTVSAAGVFQAGKTGGNTEVKVSWGGITGTAAVTIVENPVIYLINQSSGSYITGTTVTLEPGEKLDLTTSARYNHMSLVTQDTAYSWACSNSIGTIDKNGVFTAGAVDASGLITATVGSSTATLYVHVGKGAKDGVFEGIDGQAKAQEAPVSKVEQDEPDIIGQGRAVEGFESGGFALSSASGALTASLETDMTKVRYGYQSAKLAYDFSQVTAEASSSKKVSAQAGITFSDNPGYINLWVYGDGSGNSLSATIQNEDGTADSLWLATLNFTGWRYVSGMLPADAVGITGIYLVQGDSSASSGTIWIDQIITSAGPFRDTTPPEILLSAGDTALTGTVSDASLTPISQQDIAVTYDGVLIDFSYNSTSSLISAQLPEADGKAHRLTVTASDSSGNLASASLNLWAGAEQPFSDMSGHWAEKYTAYLYDQGIVAGVSSSGGLSYQPDKNMTRSEFAVIMANWMGIDTASYAGGSLPFGDSASIPNWALNSVKAMYSIGVIKGSSSGGKLLFNPAGSITRQEAMTIIGRTQPRGYTQSSLSVFTDGAQVADWSAPYIRALISQGVISGSDGKILPGGYVTRAQVAKMLYSLI